MDPNSTQDAAAAALQQQVNAAMQLFIPVFRIAMVLGFFLLVVSIIGKGMSAALSPDTGEPEAEDEDEEDDEGSSSRMIDAAYLMGSRGRSGQRRAR